MGKLKLAYPLLLSLLIVLGNADLKDVDNKLLTNRKSIWWLYTDPTYTQMVLITEENGFIRDCYVSGDEYLIQSSFEKVPPDNVMVLDKEGIFELSDYCTWAKRSPGILVSSGEEVYEEFGIFSGLFIYPGTKWCGAGNISKSYDDLGPEREADICCRDHDHCNDSIGAFSSNHGLQNHAAYTKSHCSCDDKFHNCLREANTRASNRIGRIYFNGLQIECFKFEHPITGCKRHVGSIRRRCQEYYLDQEEEPVWQFFDAKEYIPKSSRTKFLFKPRDAFDYLLQLDESSWIKSLPMNGPYK